MKSAMLRCRQWPRVVLSLRALCKFLRVEPYRKHLQRVVASIDSVDADKLSKSFGASLAKWRFETLFNVLST